mmetsp:Transcript_93447/g.166286  ORF Transcript_93447/g.166286 Transcript_93447/m.166286 type:complete len:219 (+) Transcript_93447:30-686(+)
MPRRARRASLAAALTVFGVVALLKNRASVFSVLAAAPEDAGEPKLLGAAKGPGTSLGKTPSTGPVPLARVAPRKFKILFTCKICETRNSHMISRLAYQQGIVIATCPGCNSRHLLADKTGLLDIGIWDVESLADQGENVTRLTTDGVVRVTPREMSTSQVGREVSTSQIGGLEEPPLLVRNQDGLLEAILEDGIGISRAADFLSGDANHDGASLPLDD